MILFIVTGLIGLLFFIGSLIFGGHDAGGDHDFGGHDAGGHDAGGDHEHSGTSVLSVFNVAWFLIGFGGMGMILRAQDVGMPASTISGVFTGAACWALAFFVMHMLTKQQGDSTVTLGRMKDVVATVTMPITGNGMGKIQCSVAGSSQEFLARSANTTTLLVGSQVRIVGDSGGVYLVEAV